VLNSEYNYTELSQVRRLKPSRTDSRAFSVTAFRLCKYAHAREVWSVSDPASITQSSRQAYPKWLPCPRSSMFAGHCVSHTSLERNRHRPTSTGRWKFYPRYLAKDSLGLRTFYCRFGQAKMPDLGCLTLGIHLWAWRLPVSCVYRCSCHSTDRQGVRYQRLT